MGFESPVEDDGDPGDKDNSIGRKWLDWFSGDPDGGGMNSEFAASVTRGV